jgi:hypothetical protein
LVQKRVLRSINQQLLVPDLGLAHAPDETMSPRLHFLRLLLQEVGLLCAKRGQIRVTGQPDRVPEFWEQSLEIRTEACIQAWVNMPKWSELTSLSLSSFDLQLPGARRRLVEQLRLMPPTEWLSSERFLARLKNVSPRLLFGTREPHANDISDGNQDDTARQRSKLTEIEAAFVGFSLSGPLHWLGVVDVSMDGERVLAFRINASGARVLATDTAREGRSGDQGRLIVQPNFRVFALGAVPEATLARLEMFADRVHADQSAFEYQLSRDTIYRAQRRNWAVADSIAFLAEHASVPIPQNVLRTLQEWGKQQERIRLYRSVSLFETATPQLLNKLWDDRAVRIHLERQVTPTVAIIRKRRISTLQEVLLRHGMLPRRSSEKSICNDRLEATQHGELRPVREGPDMLLRACLQRLAEERDGRFYVTEAAVTRALSEGMTVPQYIRELEMLHLGPPPPALLSRIKAWGRYYGKAHLREALLLEVKDPTVAAELLADPGLKGMLSYLPGDPEGRVLLVETDDLETLRRTLDQYGIALTEHSSSTAQSHS